VIVCVSDNGFSRSNNLNAHSSLADVLNLMADEEEDPTKPFVTPLILVAHATMPISTRAHAFMDNIPQVEMDFPALLVMKE
jgi:hypothetical protein